MTEKIRLRSIEGMGENWATIMRWADAAFRDAGFETQLERKGRDGLDTVRWLSAGETDVTVSLTSASANSSTRRMPGSAPKSSNPAPRLPTD